jgi:hypothetical protein
VTLAIGIVGMAILSLVGILGSTFQQVDDIMQTNRALSGVTRLIGALDNPRSIVYLDATTGASNANTVYVHQSATYKALLDPNPTTSPATNFDISYRLLKDAKTSAKGVWLYVYERKVLPTANETSVAGDVVTYNVTSNPSVMEVAICDKDSFPPTFTSTRNVVGTPMRVRLTISKLLIGQRFNINPSSLEPDATTWDPIATSLPDSNLYALAYLPVVAEFFPHDYSERDTATTGFSQREETPVLIQNIIISR